jgi:hypothetical protein
MGMAATTITEAGAVMHGRSRLGPWGRRRRPGRRAAPGNRSRRTRRTGLTRGRGLPGVLAGGAEAARCIQAVLNEMRSRPPYRGSRLRGKRTSRP